MSIENIEKLIADHRVEFVDLRFSDMRGVQHHVTFPKSIIEPTLFEDGKMFDGSSISGWRGIHQTRSEERRVGEECVRTCSSRGSPSHNKKKKNNHSERR